MLGATVIDDGAESVVSLSFSEDGRQLVTKTRKPGGTTQYPFEAYAYQQLGQLGARVPRVIEAAEDKLVTTSFMGQLLDDQAIFYDNATIFDEIAKDLTLCRSITFEGYGSAVANGLSFYGTFKTWSDFLADSHKKLADTDVFQERQKAALLMKWDQLIGDVSLTTPSLVHGDFSMGAIFINDGAYEGTIDYGDALIGDPIMDLAYFKFKELTKPYGRDLYSMLAIAYSAHSGVALDNINKVVKFYMIYWANERIHAKNLESRIMAKFIEKTDALVRNIYDDAI